MGLSVDRVDVLRRTITVDRQLIEVGGDLSFGPPKTKSGAHTVSLPASLVDVLGEHFATEAVRRSGMAFPSTTGNLMRRSNFPRRVWKPALRQLGWIKEHPLTVKERLGHSSITVTMDRYGHLFPAQDAALADALDEVRRATFEDPVDGVVAHLPH